MTLDDGRLLFLTSDFPPQSGGIARYSFSLTKSLTNYFEKVFVLVARRKMLEEGNPEQEVKVHQRVVTGNYLRKIFRLFFHALRVVRRENISHVMASSWSPCGVVAWLLSYVVGVRYSVAAHGLDIVEPLRSRKYRFLMKQVLNRAERVFAVSHFTKRKIEELKVSKDQVAVIFNGVDVARFAHMNQKNGIIDRHNLKNKTVLLTVGRLVKRKGHDLVLQALKELKGKYDSVIYLIVGEGPESQRLKRIAEDYALTDRVVFAGFVPDEQITNYYSSCDIFVMPVRELVEAGDVEGFGIVFLEANACGKPVVGARSGGVEDAVVEDVTGLLIEPDNCEQLVDAISRLVENKELRRELGRRGKERVIKELTWDNSARKIVGYLRDGERG